MMRVSLLSRGTFVLALLAWAYTACEAARGGSFDEKIKGLRQAAARQSAQTSTRLLSALNQADDFDLTELNIPRRALAGVGYGGYGGYGPYPPALGMYPPVASPTISPPMLSPVLDIEPPITPVMGKLVVSVMVYFTAQSPNVGCTISKMLDVALMSALGFQFQPVACVDDMFGNQLQVLVPLGQLSASPPGIVAVLGEWATAQSFCGEVSLAVFKSASSETPDENVNYGCGTGQALMTPIVPVPEMCCKE